MRKMMSSNPRHNHIKSNGKLNCLREVKVGKTAHCLQKLFVQIRVSIYALLGIQGLICCVKYGPVSHVITRQIAQGRKWPHKTVMVQV